MDAPGYLDALQDRATALRASARGNLDAPVPSCPDWTVADLVTHVGTTWGWAASIVRTGNRDNLPSSPVGAGDAALVPWAEDRAHQLIGALTAADPDTNCWTFGLPRSRLFWFRRQALETAVHAWDVQQAVGRPDPLHPELAGDGIDEFVAVMLPRTLRSATGSWIGQSLHLHRTDGEGEWMIRLGPGTAVAAEHAHGKADVALRGPASSLYLWCSNRVPSSELEVLGAAAVADLWTAEIAI